MMQFSKLRLLHPDVAPVTCGVIAVMDFGSSAINLTIYDVDQSQHGAYKILDKTKIDTAAGAARTADGQFYLGQDVIAVLEDAAQSMAEMLTQYSPDYVVATATSVFRDALDGPKWCEEQYQKRGWLINLIDGETEARLSALGALSNIDCTSGLVIDQGGGSLEVYDISSGRSASFPFGVYSLMKLAEGSPLRATQMVEEALQQLGWVAEVDGDLVTVGRAMRTIGKMLVGEETQQKTVSRDAMMAMATDLTTGRVDAGCLKAYPGYETRLPYRGAVLQAVLKVSPLQRIRFADFALREGVLLTQTGWTK